MANETTRRAARSAIQEEIQRLMRDDLPEEIKRELWRVQMLTAINDDGASLRKVHDEALDLRTTVLPADARDTLNLIMSIARYESDIRPEERKK
jgi:hypothetical protein